MVFCGNPEIRRVKIRVPAENYIVMYVKNNILNVIIQIAVDVMYVT